MSGAQNVIQISTTDGEGGASRAARRLHDALPGAGWESWFVAGLPRVGGGNTSTLTAEAGPALEALAPYFRSSFGELRMPLPSSRRFPKADLFRRASVINLHNLHGGYFDYRALPAWAAEKPLVMTLHDMWAFTGHCAYSFGCERWETECHACPMWGELKGLDEIPRTPWDNSRREWRRKRDAYARTPLTVVAPSRWLAGLAERSILAADAVHVVPYGLDTEAYAPMDRAAARGILGIAPDAPVVAFGAASLGQERKGIGELIGALDVVRRDVPGVELLAMGGTLGLPAELAGARMVGSVSDPHLQRAVYAAADLVALPSLADNQPLAMLEAMACGVPVVAFAAGGIPETVRDGETGRLAAAGDAQALAAAIAALLQDTEQRDRLGAAAREHVEREHTLAAQAQRYAEIYSAAVTDQARRSAAPTVSRSSASSENR